MTVTIIGLGLIGGSLAKDLRALRFSQNFLGVDENQAHASKALELGFVDKICDLKTAVSQSDLVVLAIPVDAIQKVLPEVMDCIKPDAIVTDMGSTKEKICESVQSHALRARFVPSHPMAGTENSGPTAALSGLFIGKTAVLCDVERSAADALQIIEKMYLALGMRPIRMNSAEHDLHAAFVSHLSHISSFVLANTVLDLEKDNNAIFSLAGGGFESTVRLAKSSPSMWAPIFAQNQKHLIRALGAYAGNLLKFQKALQDRDYDGARALMEAANRIRPVLARISAPSTKPSDQKDAVGTELKLQSLRLKIDSLDAELLKVLAARKEAVEEIGRIKKSQGLTALQKARWEELMAKRTHLATELGLDHGFVKSIFESIHEESLRLQSDILSKT